MPRSEVGVGREREPRRAAGSARATPGKSASRPSRSRISWTCTCGAQSPFAGGVRRGRSPAPRATRRPRARPASVSSREVAVERVEGRPVVRRVLEDDGRAVVEARGVVSRRRARRRRAARGRASPAPRRGRGRGARCGARRVARSAEREASPRVEAARLVVAADGRPRRPAPSSRRKRPRVRGPVSTARGSAPRKGLPTRRSRTRLRRPRAASRSERRAAESAAISHAATVLGLRHGGQAAGVRAAA